MRRSGLLVAVAVNGSYSVRELRSRENQIVGAVHRNGDTKQS